MPADNIVEILKNVLKEARDKLNDGKQGDGIWKSPMAGFYSVRASYWDEFVVKLQDSKTNLNFSDTEREGAWRHFIVLQKSIPFLLI